MSSKTMALRVEAARLLSSLMYQHELYLSSEYDRVPVKIEPGHPIDKAILALKATYPGGELPFLLKQHTLKLLHYSRTGDAAAFEEAESLSEVLHNAFGGIPKKPRLDGLYAPDILRWNGQETKLSQTTWDLLNALWLESCMEVSTLNVLAWGDDEDDEGSRLRSTLHRVNLVLRRVGVLWRYRLQKGNVVRRDKSLICNSPAIL